MNLDRLQSIASAAMQGVPHSNPAETLAILGYLSRDKREEAASIYAAVIGEKTLPAHIGIKHALPPIRKPLAGAARVKRAAQARRILEERREMANV